jgi:hypothetical protein
VALTLNSPGLGRGRPRNYFFAAGAESDHAVEVIDWRMFLSANRYPLRRNMR